MQNVDCLISKSNSRLLSNALKRMTVSTRNFFILQLSCAHFGAHFGFPLSVCGSCVRIKCCALLYVCLWVVDNVELHGVLGKGMRPIVSTVDHPMRFIAFDCFGDYDKSLRSISIILRILKSRD